MFYRRDAEENLALRERLLKLTGFREMLVYSWIHQNCRCMSMLFTFGYSDGLLPIASRRRKQSRVFVKIISNYQVETNLKGATAGRTATRVAANMLR